MDESERGPLANLHTPADGRTTFEFVAHGVSATSRVWTDPDEGRELKQASVAGDLSFSVELLHAML